MQVLEYRITESWIGEEIIWEALLKIKNGKPDPEYFISNGLGREDAMKNAIFKASKELKIPVSIPGFGADRIIPL